MQVVNDRWLVQMRQLCHIVGFVKLGGVDFVDRVSVNLLLSAVVALYQKPAMRQVLDNPTPDKCSCRVSEPDIALAGEVVLTLEDPTQPWWFLAVLGYELGREGAGRGGVAGRVGT